MLESNNHIANHDEVQELVNMFASSPADFEHLQVFLHRERLDDIQPDDEFFMVTPTSFGKIKLLDVSVEDQFVILKIKDCSTQKVGNVRVDICDESPRTFFICWQDVKRMVLDETRSTGSDDDLLEFCF